MAAISAQNDIGVVRTVPGDHQDRRGSGKVRRKPFVRGDRDVRDHDSTDEVSWWDGIDGQAPQVGFSGDAGELEPTAGVGDRCRVGVDGEDPTAPHPKPRLSEQAASAADIDRVTGRKVIEGRKTHGGRRMIERAEPVTARLDELTDAGWRRRVMFGASVPPGDHGGRALRPDTWRVPWCDREWKAAGVRGGDRWKTPRAATETLAQPRDRLKRYHHVEEGGDRGVVRPDEETPDARLSGRDDLHGGGVGA